MDMMTTDNQSSLMQEESNLIVANAAKILFDEKLTAFIRQNSSSNEDNTSDLANDADFSTIEDTEDQEDMNTRYG